MATNRTRRTRNRTSAGGLTEADYLYFTWGPFFEAEDYADGKTDEELVAFWKKHRTAIMDRYMSELRAKGPGWEGSRPDMFWKELTEPRLPVDMTLADDELYDSKKVGAHGLEADYAYLKRLGLLEAWEMND